MLLARFHSNLQSSPSFREEEIAALKQAVRIPVTGNLMTDLLQASAGLLRLRAMQATLRESPTVSLRQLTVGVSQAPMARTDIEEDFV